MSRSSSTDRDEATAPAPPAPKPAPAPSEHKILLGGLITAIEALAAQIPGGHGMAPQIARLRFQLQNLRE